MYYYRKDAMEGSERTPEQLEQEAVQRAEQEQREKAEQDAVEQAAAAGTPLPDPNSEPGNTDPQLEQVDVPCAGCGQVYEFDIQSNTATFSFQCRECGTKSEWKRL